MLEPRGARTKGYVLTHQLLFAQLSLSLGCEEVYEKALRVLAMEHPSDVKTVTSMRHLFNVGCANVYLEMNKTVSDSEATKEPIDSIAQDIFLEQGTICTYYGYPAMVLDAWLARALQFQTGLGCLDDGRHIAANAGEDLVKYWCRPGSLGWWTRWVEQAARPGNQWIYHAKVCDTQLPWSGWF